MFFNLELKKIDKVICRYLGIEYDQIFAKTIRWANQQLLVTHTSSFKRHVMESHWEEYRRLPDSKVERLGHCLGRVIADQLVVSFEKPRIKLDKR